MHNHVGQVSMHQHLMQPRRCGAVNLKSWRTDRKPPGARLSSLRFRPGAYVPQRPGAGLCWLTEAFNTPVLQEAKALLDELAA